MVINRDKHNKFFTIVDNTKPQGPTDNQGQSSGDNGNTGSSSGSTGGNTTIIYQGGGMTEDQNNKLNGIEEGAEKNQDAFSYITIQGATSEEDVTLSADDPTDTFKLAAKDSVTLTLEDDVITIGCDGVKYLKELLDVDAQNPLDEDLLIYNSETEKWEAINPQFATIEWVNEQFDKIIGSAPEVLDTIYEIAEALGNDPDYVKDIANNLSALTNRVTITEQDITDIKSKLLPTNFTDLTSGQLLQYDGQYWVNVDKDAVGLNEDQLLEYLTTNNYAKKSDITWSNLIGKPSIYATNIANITDLNSGWDSLLANAPTKYITRWPNFSEIGSKPTTLVGYGITDGVNSVTTSGTGNVITGATVSGHVLTLNKGITAITSVSLATINDLHANWDAVLKVAPTKYVTRWPSWAEVTDKPDWIESDKPSYSWSEITGKPSVFATNIANITDLHSTWDAVLKATKPNWLTIVSLATITDLQANWDAILKVAPTSQVTRWPTWAEVTSKPSTLSGYGITDGVNAVSVTGSGNVVSSASISGHTLTLNKGITALTSVSIATISDLHSSWDAVLKAQKPAWLTSVSLATISDLNASWDALLKAAPSAYVTRWPTAAEVGALTQTTADGRYLLKSSYTAADVLAKLKTVDGSGSGIDADLLDGYHISNIETGGWTSFVTYIYDATNGTRNYCYRIGNLNNSGDVILRIRVVDDINYPSYSEWTLRMAYNSSYVPVVSLVPNTTCRNTLTVYVDTSKYLWIKCNAAWNSSMQYKIEHNTGNILITSNPSRVETSPSNVSYTFSNFGSTRDGVANGSYYHWSSVYVGALSGNATSATKLQTARTINGTSFDGTANITTSKWGTARTLTLTGAVTGSVSIDGSGNVSLATTYSTGSAGPLDGRYALIGGSNATGTWPISITGSSARITSTVYNSGSLASLTTAGRLYHAGGGNTVTDKPSGVDAFGLFTMRTAAGWQGQILMSANTATGLYWRTANNNFNGGWRTILDSSNYTSTLDNRYVTLSTAQTISSEKTFGAPVHITGSEANNIETVRNDNGSITTNRITVSSSIRHALSFKWYQSDWQIGNIRSGSIGSEGFGITKDNSNLVFRVNEHNAWVNGGVVLHTNNYTSYTVTKTGGGASGTWGISITGNAATATNADTLDGRQGTSYGIMWGGMNTATDPGADDTTSTSITDFLTRLNYSGIFGSRFGAMRGSWYYVGNTQYNTGVGTLEMAGTAVLNMSHFADASANYKTLLFLEGPTGNMYSYVSQQSGTARWSRYAKTTDNVASATKLATARQINGTNFDGTANVTTAKWGTARSIYIRDASQAHTGAAVSVDGSANEYLLLPSTITATLSGNASTASKWATARTLTLTGAVTGSVSIDGSGNVSMATTYATGNISALDSRYVNISGDTMTGNLTATSFTASSNAFTLGDTVYTNGRLAFVDGALWLQSSQNGKIQISGRNGSDLTDFNVKVSSHSVATINDSVIWTAGNDGSGSGLDADLLDGTHKTGLLTSVTSSSTTNLSVAVGGTTKSVADLYATYLDGVTLAGLRGLGYAMQSTTIDASSLDEDTWYPVTIKLDARDQVLIALIVSLDSGTKPSWSTHTVGFSVRKVWYSNGSGWGTNAINRVVLFSDYSFTDTDPVRGIGQMSYSSNEYVYVRGGGKYHFYTSHAKRTITLHSSTYTVYGQSVSPTTTAPAAIVRNNAYTTDNVASATKLQTARTIWGQSFNGTAPVSGNMTGVGSISASGNITTDNALFQIDATNISGDRGLNVLYNGQRVLCGFGTSGSKGLFITHSGSSPGWVLSVPSSTVLAIAQNSGINVGIGTTSPSYKLHVAGTGYFSGTLSTSSSIIANSYIYSNEGWFQNKKADTGLYNSVVDARWYATSGGWISDKKINATAGLAVTGGASVSGDLTIGLTSQILRTGSSTSWINGRDGALVRNTTYKGYNAIISAKTTNGSWQLGPYENDLLYFTYTTDANYNAGTNNATYNITLPKKTGTIALTSDIPSITDIVTGNAGSATQGVYVSGSEVKAMTYSLHAHVNSGLTSRLAVYNTNTAISYMNTTVGSQSKPIFISSGVPTACTELNTIPHYGKYYINSREATYNTIRHNHTFITSIVRQAEGQLLISIDVPGSMALNHIFIWGAGQYTHIDTNADSGCYISIYYVNSYQIRVTVHDNASANDGYFYLYFLAIG